MVEQDPVLNPPDWYRLVDRNGRIYSHPFVNVDSEVTMVAFGDINGHHAAIYVYDGDATFLWGCREKASEEEARQHWVDNVSMVSGWERPHATRLIDWVALICKQRGWRW